MKKVNYEVKTATGETYVTADYVSAHAKGNKVVTTFYTEVPDPADEKGAENLVKFWEKCAKQRTSPKKGLTNKVKSDTIEKKKEVNPMMNVIGDCVFCGGYWEVEVTEEQFMAYQFEGQPVQKAFPNLGATERECLISGICPTCQAKLFGQAGARDAGKIYKKVPLNLYKLPIDFPARS